MRRRPALAAIPVLIALSAFPGPAGAADATITVTVDQPAAVPAGHNWAFDDFFPRGLTVARGTTIDFAIEGFHTATLLAHGTTVAADLLASGIAGADTDDTGKNLNGSKPHTVFRPQALAPQLPSAGCGTAASPCTFDGSATVSSGAPSGPGAGPFAVTVDAAPGVYLFHCRVHPKMVATLRVVASGSSAAETAAQVSAAAERQVKVDVAEAKIAEARLSAHAMSRNANGSATWRVSVGGASRNGFVSLLEFLPRNVTLHRGDRVLWVAPDGDEPHTITFPGDLHTDTVPLCEGQNGKDTPATPTANPPTGPQDFACGSGPVDELEFGGGNGVRRLSSATTVADSGVVGNAQLAAGFGIPASAMIHTWSVTLEPNAAKTVYHYVCQIHEGMAATITVH